MPQHQVILKRHSAEGSLRKHWLVVGLGNPGQKYARTRHTLGARVVETLAKQLGRTFRHARALHARVSRGRQCVAIPTTFMNESGHAVTALVAKEKVPLDHLLIVHDDKDLAFGTIKLQKGRGSGGHRGVQSVIEAVGSQAFWRLRVGIGAPQPGTPTDAYVLQTFTKNEEQELARDVIPRAVERLQRIIQGLGERTV